MKFNITILFVVLFNTIICSVYAQIICVNCTPQLVPISPAAPNLVANGSFESTTMFGGSNYFCPNSGIYGLDFNNWICSGGGPSTYAQTLGVFSTQVPDGVQTAYLGNSFCYTCLPGVNDASCIIKSNCDITGVPPNMPDHDPAFGGNIGVSLEQTVNGLTVGSVYVLEFWSGGEQGSNMFPNDGIFALDIGFGRNFYISKPTDPNIATEVGLRYTIEFRATSTSHKIKFTNYGHICANCTEIILDDVRLYKISDASPNYNPCSPIDTIANYTKDTTICAGKSVIMNGKTYSSTGIYKDSIIFSPTHKNYYNLNLHVVDCYHIIYIDSVICPGDSITINGYLFHGDSTISDTIKNSSLDYDITTIHVALSSCSSVFIPNVFSPNGDGLNDIIHAFVVNIDACDFQIYNRWGERMFHTKNPSLGWDGLFHNRNCDIGTYYYFFKYKDKLKGDVIIKGDILLIR
jgi:gliding motility-associated-like protein